MTTPVQGLLLHWPVIVVSLVCWSALPLTDGLQQMLNTNSSRSCNQPHYYEFDSIYDVSSNTAVTGSKCEVTFTKSTWSDTMWEQRCSLCVKINTFTIHSCHFKMIYHDGLADVKPKTFDCHTFPPLLWCSSNNDLKLVFKELKKYKGDKYTIDLQVKPYCSKNNTKGNARPTPSPPGKTYEEKVREEEKRRRDTVIIAGSLISTVSIMFVLCYLTYSCWKRRNPRPNTSSQPPGTSSRGSSSTRSNHNKPPGVIANTRIPMDRHHGDNHSREGQTQPWYTMHPMTLPSSELHSQGYTPSHDQWLDTRYTKLPELNPKPTEMKGYTYVPPHPHRLSPTKEVVFHEDMPRPLRPDVHSYDADVDLPQMTGPSPLPPPLPPRPNLPQYQSKQYFI
ncbi:uncharacterized protein LOC117331597 [Pecten maximus]|uniref:uncharacterized protein LOC117331597 n=1 Tax=Pecten maximus TaxID=6579 RepID=UPI0014585F81|nr:uncharacterized protein LOC117331597 [Pecten maximus]XP_033746295.1 uncharacterized protein LOC117331597 [Pecten maximus]